jgi:hypothetical protein
VSGRWGSGVCGVVGGGVVGGSRRCGAVGGGREK